MIRETDKLLSQLGKKTSFFIQLGIDLFNWVSLCLIVGHFKLNWVFPQNT